MTLDETLSMKRILYFILPLLVVALGIGLWLHFNGDEAKIRRTFDAVAADVEKDGEMALFTQALHIKSVSERVADRCRFRLLPEGPELTVTRKEFSEIFAYCIRDMHSLHVAFRDLDIAVDGPQADVAGTADFSGSDATPCIGGALVRPFTVRMEKSENGDWLFRDVAVR